MERGRKYFVFLGTLIGAVAIALFLGAVERGVAETLQPTCNDGKPVCVSITDQLQASRSTAGDHYLTDSFVVSNGGTTSNFTNITLTVTWADAPERRRPSTGPRSRIQVHTGGGTDHHLCGPEEPRPRRDGILRPTRIPDGDGCGGDRHDAHRHGVDQGAG